MGTSKAVKTQDPDTLWVSAGIDNRGVETLLRRWFPGDGLYCSYGNHQRREPCGKPVAASKTINPEGNRRFSGGVGSRMEYYPKVTNRILCAAHLASLFALSPGETRAQAEREAREELIAEHWDEYQASYKARIAAKREEQVNKIPESLRETLSNVDWDELNDGALS